MCGITGFIGCQKHHLQDIIQAMTDQISHRGPDDAGIWCDGENGLAFGHRRLSIIDLSPLGHQPMHSASERYTIIFNGEIYNYQSIRSSLIEKGHTFKGESDTEVMLAAFEEWSLEDAVKMFNGMFAFALWDNSEKLLHLVRDRIGIKPLYYGWQKDTFFFGSELKSFRPHSDFLGDINRDALALMMRHNYIPAPYSIYQGIYKLPPGCIFSLKLNEVTRVRDSFSPYPNGPDSSSRPKAYWSARSVVESGIRNRFQGTPEEAQQILEEALMKSVKRRMISDVPLGAFLSGGVDSSTVVALMQAQSSIPIKTFSIGFYEDEYNEAQYAKKVAEHLGTDHTELYLPAKDAMDVIPLLPTLYDEPFSDSSQIPTYLVSKLARQHVTVSLSGDGGDELFCGYGRYLWAKPAWRMLKNTPSLLKKSVASGITLLTPDMWDAIYKVVDPLLPQSYRVKAVGYKAHKLAELMQIDIVENFYTRLVSHWDRPESLVLHSKEPVTFLTDSQNWFKDIDYMEEMMFLDLITYLPDDILVKVDRASMGVSLEARVPLLDHEVVELAWTLPHSMKLNNKVSKHILRNILYKYVPKHLIERPKMGFGIPMNHWLKKPLRDWAESLLNQERLENEGFFDSNLVRKYWNDHLEGKGNWQNYLWDVLMFQAWLENTRSNN